LGGRAPWWCIEESSQQWLRKFTGSVCMLRVDKSLSYLNDMLHHPSMFRLDTLKQKYVSKSTLNSGVRLDSSALVLPYHLQHYRLVQSSIHKNREFLIFLVFKLLERGIYISARNVGVLESVNRDAAMAADPPSRLGPPDGDGDRSKGGGKKIVHCDILAFNAKKRHVYAIVVCDRVCQFQECRAHALRVARIIRCLNPRYSTVFACVLTVYNFERAGSMRLCPVSASAAPLPARIRQKRMPRAPQRHTS